MTLTARFKKIDKAERVVLTSTGRFRFLQKLLSKTIAKALKGLHPNIYAVPGKRPTGLLLLMLLAKRQGLYGGKADLRSAYFRVHRSKMRKILLKAGIPDSLLPLLGLNPELLKIENSTKTYRGLPQGFNTSPILYAHYINPVIRRLNNGRYTVFVYVDDLYWVAPDRKSAKECLRFIRKVLYQYDRHLVLNSRPSKAPTICGPNEPWRVLGYTLN